MVNETTQIEKHAAEDTDAPLIVEVPSEIRAGVRVAPVQRDCSPYSSCYSNLTQTLAL